jgi:hypothetical protein
VLKLNFVDFTIKNASKLVGIWPLEEDWLLAIAGREIKKIDPLD